MRNYGQFCPIARASELLAERWTLIILRNLLIGCRTFNENADGAPGLSRGLLSKRLQEFERAGVIEIRRKTVGHGSAYEPTEAGRELWGVMLALQRWGSRWTELTPDHAHPGLVLWFWVGCALNRENLPKGRVLVALRLHQTEGDRTQGLAAGRSWRRRALREVPRRRGGPRRPGP